MSYTKILRSSIGTFATRIGLSVAIFLGVFYLAAATEPLVLGIYSLFVAVVRVLDLLTNLGIVEAAQKRISEGTERAEFFTAALLVRLGLFAPVGIIVIIFHQQIAAYVGRDLVVPFLLAGAFCYLIRKAIEAGLIGKRTLHRLACSSSYSPLGS
ncbi:hypothetical protein ACFQL7_06700 [Halocatena marina]|uniref:Lipopolysaccharide biosynthesis protein n=2 Tax=Halocatena marina TaxID=2934937 RepID=A0ABD5YJK5_9EURY